MEIILIAVTIGALLMALLMSAAAWRVSREERVRTAARVAALAAAASEPEPRSQPRPAQTAPVARNAEPELAATLPDFPREEPSAASPIEPRPTWTPARVSAFTPARISVAPSASRVADVAPTTPPQELPLQPAAPPIADSFLGLEERRPSEGRQRGLAIAAAILFVMLGGVGYWLISGGRGADAASASASTAAAGAPLELMSLRHERVGSRLSLSGLVRNPSAGAAVEDLSAVVFLFDAQGAFITSARSAVDFKRLAPGDESPFVITMDAPSNVARYRVSFRTDSGILAHVDRRAEQPAATAITATKS